MFILTYLYQDKLPFTTKSYYFISMQIFVMLYKMYRIKGVTIDHFFLKMKEILLNKSFYTYNTKSGKKLYYTNMYNINRSMYIF